MFISAEIFLTGYHWVHISLHTIANEVGQLFFHSVEECCVVRVSALFRCREILSQK